MNSSVLYRYFKSGLANIWQIAAILALASIADAGTRKIDRKHLEPSEITIGIKDIDHLGNTTKDLGYSTYSLKEWDLKQQDLQKNRELLLKKLALLNQGSEGISISQILNFGSKLWKLVEKNKPVSNLTTVTANALPANTDGNWLSLENWSEPRGRIYSVTYKNLYGIEVVNFDYRLTFTPGGSYQGSGQYLSNVAVNPQNLSVSWSYNVDATAKVVNVLNARSKANPLAGMEVLVDWRVKTVVKDMRSSTSFFVKGDGTFIDLNEGL